MSSLHSSTNFVPARYARSLLRLAQRRKFDVGQVLVSAGVDFNPLDASCPEFISAIHYSRIYQQVLTLLQDESFGMPPARGMSAGAFRMMCYAIIHCETLGKAMRRLIEFIEIFYDPRMHLHMELQGERVTLSYPHYQEMPLAQGRAGEAYGLALWHRFFCWLIGLPIGLDAVRLASPAPLRPERYHHLFGVEVGFALAANGIDFHSRYLELPIAQNEASLREFLRTAPYQMMVDPEPPPASGLVAAVRREMGNDLSQGFPSFEEVAQKLNLSPPTLRRHLHKEGVSYQGLKDQYRKEAAKAYLARPELSISSVSALMGFTDPSAFHRSFRKWTGMTPCQFRQQELSFGEDP